MRQRANSYLVTRSALWQRRRTGQGKKRLHLGRGVRVIGGFIGAVLRVVLILTAGTIPALLSANTTAAGRLEECAAAYDRQDYAAALQLCRPLAEQGDARAQTSLGGMYYNGQGVQRDYAEAAKWARRAAEQGYAPAQADLGVMYWNGQGVPQDAVLAYMWLILADAQEPDAVEERDMAASQMTLNEIAEAQRLAREWKPTK